jgi:hypothetical protein
VLQHLKRAQTRAVRVGVHPAVAQRYELALRSLFILLNMFGAATHTKFRPNILRRLARSMTLSSAPVN